MYERSGIDRLLNNEKQFDLYGANTVFRKICCSVVNNVVESGLWFSFCTRIKDTQVDIMSFKNDEGVKLGSFVSEYYPDTLYRSAIYKYLLRDYLCYYECPTVARDGDHSTGYKSAYNKFLATSNLYVVAEWLGISLEEADLLYGSRLDEVVEDNGCDMFQYLKLYSTRDGEHKVTKPRKDLDLGLPGTRVVPLFALEQGVNFLYEKSLNNFVNISFIKDGGIERSINTTFNIDKLKDVYGSTDFFRKGVALMYDGDFKENPYLERGYIKVFEVGSSKYDSPERAINFARIVEFEEGEPDLTYVNIDLSSVISTFDYYINDNSAYMDEIVDMLDVFEVGTSREIAGKRLKTPIDIQSWVSSQELLLGTVFLRQLALFMIGNPQWFNGYTGEPMLKDSSSNSNDALNQDFDFEMSL